ncbi:glycoside hydrolase family 76 protein [Paenibacillus sp. P13VS]|uniref:glycoside hydrolase family 76 protein n=1 Tax=Paenibacillus sp. P13VS TaxID=2697367 RepID=UPI00187B546C|nr:glycoside hydrolase family 76 protein [Paenibacillus sp. P13VS]MBE7679860.1 glycosyl hydrolase [Paenibacillus sp. P13VS]
MRKKKIVSLTVVLSIILVTTMGASGGGKKHYASQAQWAQEKLDEYYWNDEAQMMNNAYPSTPEGEEPLNYWWKAHAVDALVDGYERTGDKAYTERAEELVRSIIERNGSLHNEFYDDMEWLALAALRLYDATGSEEMKDYVLELWADIKTAWWEDDLGGMAWKKDQRYNRNACSSGPASILAARLYERFGDPQDLEWAQKIYEWEKHYLVNPQTGLVADGLVLREDGTLDVNEAWIFTYNQGTFIGAGVELYRITGDQVYLQDAEKTAAGSLKSLTNEKTGIFLEDGDGDGALFKGILIRYMVELYDAGHNKALKKAIFRNADALWKGSRNNGLFGQAWGQPAQNPLHLTAQLSGVFLLEAAAKLEEGTRSKPGKLQK